MFRMYLTLGLTVIPLQTTTLKMGDSGNPPDLLSAALCESGLSLDDILNPSLEDDGEDPTLSSDPSSVLAQVGQGLLT